MASRVSTFVSSLPVTVRIGIGLVLAGLVVDIAYHGLASHPTVTAPCCGPGFLGHVLTLTGMVIAFSGAVATGVRHRSRHRPQERRH